jgi:heme exporter protein D
MGEIQFYSTKGRFTPEYIKINKDQQKLYPGGLLEEEFEVQKDHISNLFTQRMILGRFYNGIDENLVIQEVVIQPNFELFIAIALLIVALIALIKGILDKRKKLKPTKSRKKRQPKRKKTTKKNPE